MHNIRAIREDPKGFDAAMMRRGLPPKSHEILELDAKRREIIRRDEARKEETNLVSRVIGSLIREGRVEEAAALRVQIAKTRDALTAAGGVGALIQQGRKEEADLLFAQVIETLKAAAGSPEATVKLEVTAALRAQLAKTMDAMKAAGGGVGSLLRQGRDKEADALSDQIIETLKAARGSPEATVKLEVTAAEVEKQIKHLLDSLPNILDPDVPDGRDESANKVLAVHGAPRDLGFEPKQHFELGETLGMMDFATAAKLAGARFTVLRGPLARLERALGQFMLDLHTREHGYEEMVVPSLVNDAAVYGTGQLPKFSEDLFQTTDGRWLIPTAEVPLTNSVAGEIIAEKALPIRLTALTDCFRSEAGAAGRDTRGMMRQHQFRKVELVSICAPEASAAEHEHMTRSAEKVLSLLEVPFRRVVLSSGDTGFGAAKTHDLEVWLPGQQAWREISSCSNCRDFQARRMNARYRAADGKAVSHVHTLNGSGVALGRALIAVMENHQQADGAILIPEVLWPYMGGMERIAPA